jgi:hypothetical protein
MTPYLGFSFVRSVESIEKRRGVLLSAAVQETWGQAEASTLRSTATPVLRSGSATEDGEDGWSPNGPLLTGLGDSVDR